MPVLDFASVDAARLTLLKFARALQITFKTNDKGGGMSFPNGAPAGIISALAYLELRSNFPEAAKSIDDAIKEMKGSKEVDVVTSYFPEHSDRFKIHGLVDEVVNVRVFRDNKGLATHTQCTVGTYKIGKKSGHKVRFSESATWAGKFEFLRINEKGRDALAASTAKPIEKENKKAPPISATPKDEITLEDISDKSRPMSKTAFRDAIGWVNTTSAAIDNRRIKYVKVGRQTFIFDLSGLNQTERQNYCSHAPKRVTRKKSANPK